MLDYRLLAQESATYGLLCIRICGLGTAWSVATYPVCVCLALVRHRVSVSVDVEVGADPRATSVHDDGN